MRLTITALNACVGGLFLVRSPVIRRASVGPILVTLPSLIMSGAALKLAGPASSWVLAASLLFAGGGALTILSLTVLGRCFALLPAVRGVITAGPFRVVRHPAYAGEVAMVAACSIASSRPSFAWPATAIAAALLGARIIVEERLLAELPAYREYMNRVRFRLLPGVW
jgi:protein-S-isoprenylcysteine O-methyltransferase Ste14